MTQPGPNAFAAQGLGDVLMPFETDGPVSRTWTADPAEFIQRLAFQNQLLACLKWLNDFQVLACIPLDGCISIEEAADLATVPEDQLRRVVRLTAMTGFLQEPQPGEISHTPLSASFITNLVFVDAATFLAETAALAALHMPATTTQQRHHGHGQEVQSAYSIVFPAASTFHTECVEGTKLHRQWSAYRQCIGDVEHGVTELLGRLKWKTLGEGYIVDACARSTEVAMALSKMHPSLRFVVQIVTTLREETGPAASEHINNIDLDGRIAVQRRMQAATQTIGNADAYILRLTTPLTATPLPKQVLAELEAHLEVLRANKFATLILVLPFLPEPGTVGLDVEAVARLRDLGLLQLANQHEMEMGAILEVVNSVSDGGGRLEVVSKTVSSQGPLIVVGVKYQCNVQKHG